MPRPWQEHRPEAPVSWVELFRQPEVRASYLENFAALDEKDRSEWLATLCSADDNGKENVEGLAALARYEGKALDYLCGAVENAGELSPRIDETLTFAIRELLQLQTCQNEGEGTHQDTVQRRVHEVLYRRADDPRIGAGMFYAATALDREFSPVREFDAEVRHAQTLALYTILQRALENPLDEDAQRNVEFLSNIVNRPDYGHYQALNRVWERARHAQPSNIEDADKREMSTMLDTIRGQLLEDGNGACVGDGALGALEARLHAVLGEAQVGPDITAFQQEYHRHYGPEVRRLLRAFTDCQSGDAEARAHGLRDLDPENWPLDGASAFVAELHQRLFEAVSNGPGEGASWPV